MRPTIALACILKNEVHNLPQLLASVEGCFDEIHLTDTGSTDGSLELIETYVNDPKGNPAKTPIYLHHFEWVHDFSRARQASFDVCATDYVMWLDLDDILVGREEFIKWRDSTLKIGDMWLATYHYGMGNDGRPACSFARERVVKNSLGLKWRYFIHEGLPLPAHLKKPPAIQYVTCWHVQHKRTAEDLKADKSRNLRIFELHRGNLDARMRYYYGKELYENGKNLEAFTELMNAISDPALEHHDRIMGTQYAVLVIMMLNQFERAIEIAHQGIRLDPNRAEFYTAIGDCYLKLQRPEYAAIFFRAASECIYRGGGQMQNAIFQYEPSYKHYPLNQLSRIYFATEQFEKAKEANDKALALGPDGDSLGIRAELEKAQVALGFAKGNKVKTEDIVITCHPTNFYEWDEEIYRQKGLGGSETAAVEMAKWLSKLCGRKVIVFNNRTEQKDFEGVSYVPAGQVRDYFAKFEPKVHIAWRHNIKFTEAPTYLWCHDLLCPNIEASGNYTKVLALSDFHQEFLSTMIGVPREKIWVTSNGIEPRRWDGFELGNGKVPGRVIYSSSPDRGLDNAMRVMDRVVKAIPHAELHVFYGFDNMLKMGKHEEVEKFKKMAAERPFVKMHGNVSQKQLTEEMAKAEVWLYPTNFLETFCITAVEALCSKTYPVVRSWGALPDTIKEPAAKGMATLLDMECHTEDELDRYALHTIHALQEKHWQKIIVNPHDYAWQNVAARWIREFGL